MKFYTFGDFEKPVLMIFPGTCCHWQCNAQTLIPLLEPDFQIVFVSYDGFDETEPNAVFSAMLEETEKIEEYILRSFGGHICAAYGCSLGGSFVGLLIQRRRVRMDHGILGSSDLDQGGGPLAWLKGKIMARILHGLLQKGRLPGWLENKLEQHENADYLKAALKIFGIGSRDMRFVKTDSIFNQYYSDLTTPLENGIHLPGTTIHCFYALKMGPKYRARYLQHFKNPDIREHNLQHEELLFCFLAQWAAEVRSCCGMPSSRPAYAWFPRPAENMTPPAQTARPALAEPGNRMPRSHTE